MAAEQLESSPQHSMSHFLHRNILYCFPVLGLASDGRVTCLGRTVLAVDNLEEEWRRQMGKSIIRDKCTQIHTILTTTTGVYAKNNLDKALSTPTEPPHEQDIPTCNENRRRRHGHTTRPLDQYLLQTMIE